MLRLEENNERVYPVLLTKTETVVLVEVPDLEILTEGKDLSDAIDMAKDAIELKCVSLEDGGMNNVSRVLKEALMNVLNVKRNM